MKSLRLAALLLLSTALLTGCGSGNWSWEGGLDFKPHPGYEWVHPDSPSFATKWVPGKREPELPNIHASEREGHWNADPGYTFEGPQTLSVRWTPETHHPSEPLISSEKEQLWIPKHGHEWEKPDQQVCMIFCPDAYAAYPRRLDHPLGISVTAWKPGSRSTLLPKMRAAQEEGQWIADPGYTFPDPEVLKVEWTPGIAHTGFPNRTAAKEEGEWILAPGYTTRHSIFGEYDEWTPGLLHPEQPCLRSSMQARVWQPNDGYRFEKTVDGTIRIRHIEKEPDWAGAIVAGITALAGHHLSQAEPDDGAIATTIGRPLAKEIRNAALKGLVESLEPPEPGQCDGVVLSADWQQTP